MPKYPHAVRILKMAVAQLNAASVSFVCMNPNDTTGEECEGCKQARAAFRSQISDCVAAQVELERLPARAARPTPPM